MGQFLTNLFYGQPDIFYGHHEVAEVSEDLDTPSETSLEIDGNSNIPPVQVDTNDDCNKTINGHKDMIPVKKFRRDHLPEPYNKIDDVYNLTMALAYLTVRIKTKYVSNNRPDFLPDTKNETYPLHEKRGTKCYNSGTGRVCDVVTHRGRKCTCKDCSLSPEPKKNCWTIKVFTATHVVYDDEEAADATCTLFYDDIACNPMTLSGFKQIWSDDGGDLCLLSTVTCNKELSENLFAKIKEFNSYWRSLKKMHEKDKTRERLVILVSHPHGREKRISVGFGLDIGSIQGQRYSKFIYSSPTCPGTSGGPVYILGYDWFSTEFVHGGGMPDFDAIENLFKINPDLMTKIFPAYRTGSTVIPLSFSSAYYTDNENVEEDERETETPKAINSDTKFNFSNYSARWY